MLTKHCSLKQRRNSSANKSADVDNKFTSKNIHRKLLSQAWGKSLELFFGTGGDTPENHTGENPLLHVRLCNDAVVSGAVLVQVAQAHRCSLKQVSGTVVWSRGRHP